MANRSMSADHKKKLAEGRKRALQERNAALDAVLSNPQFVNPKFWVAVMKRDEVIVEQVEKALKKARKAKIKRELAKVEKQAEKLRQQLEE